MEIQELAAKLSAAVEGVPFDERPIFIRGWIAGHEKQDKVALTALAGVFDFQPPPSDRHIVVLIHGIRTHAVWQDAVKQMFAGTDVQVIPIGYDYLDVVRFLSPWGRGDSIARVSRELQAIKRNHPNVPISVIAHSFGTYIVSKVLAPDQGLRFKRLVLCGSIIPSNYAWEHVKGLPDRESVVNDVGSRDVWPVLAGTLTWGYGASGTYGFKQYAITDRFHDLTHSDFFSEEWVRKYWLPFICNGAIEKSDWETVRPSPPPWLSLLTVMHLKYVVLAGIAGALWRLWR